MGKIIAVSTNKGGSGKTSLVTNLAGALAQAKGKKVLIIDTDGQGNTSLAFGLNPNELKRTIYDVLMGSCSPEEAIVSVGSGVDILPSNSDMDFFDIEVLTNTERLDNPFYLLKSALKTIADNYDYVFIDTPPSLGLIAGNVMTYAETVIIPFQPELFAVRGLVRLVETVNDFKSAHNPKLSVLGVVGMMVDARTGLHKEMLQQAKMYCEDKSIRLFDTVIPKSIKFASATAYAGKPAVWVEKSHLLVHAYYDLLNELLEGDDDNE